jgi:hypothetical protein
MENSNARQYRSIIRMIRQMVAAKVAAGEDPKEIIKALGELLEGADYTRVRLGFRPQFAVGQRKRVLLTRVYGKFKCSSV